MYSLNSNTRRITSFVQQEARKWLFDKIKRDEYDAGSNRDVQRLILQIKKDGCVTPDTYSRFTSCVIFNPFDRIVQGSKPRNQKFIMTDKIENFFVKYNGVILPIGFIKDFFEDDYETQMEIDRYIESVVKGQEEIFAIKCQENLLEKGKKISDLEDKKPCVFRTRFSFHITNILKILFTVATLIVCLYFFSEYKVIDNIIALIKGENYAVLNGFLKSVLGKNAGIDAYFEKYAPHIAVNVVVLLLLIPRLIKAVKTLIYYINLFIIRGRVAAANRSIEQFESTKLEALREYFKSVIPQLSRQHLITDEMCDNAPSVRKQYLSIMEFDFQSIMDKISNLYNSKHFQFLSAYYVSDGKAEIAKKRRMWRKGVVIYALILIVMCCVNIAWVQQLIIDTYEHFF